jgi:hypothetical protein
VEQRAVGVDRRRPVAREELQGEQRRTAGGRTFVLETAAQQLQLLAKPELPDRTVGDRALTEIRTACRPFQLVFPLGSQRRELALGAGRRELVGLGGG